MQLKILAASIVGFAAASVAAPPSQPTSASAATASRCPDDPKVHLVRPGKAPEQKKLSDLPPANAYFAVYRRGPDGCVEPVIAAYGIGSAEPRRRR